MGKVLLIGLDGATFDVIRPMIDELPNIKKLMKSGLYGKLRSTPLPLTACAWVSMFTGKNPGKHGVFDFIQGVERKLVTSLDIDSETIWDILNKYDKKSVLINVPMTFPAKKINGYMITGMPYPVDTYPKSIKSILPKDYKTLPEKRNFSEIQNMGKNVFLVAKNLIKKDWDFFMVVFSSTDFVCHWFWNEKEKVKAIYKDVDRMIGELIKEAGKETSVIIASDHGMGSLKKYVYINNWLAEMGYLKFKKNMTTQIKLLLHKLGFTMENLKRINSKLGIFKESTAIENKFITKILDKFLLSFSDIDWKKTSAYSNTNYSPIFVTKQDVKEKIIRELKKLKDGNVKIVDCVFEKKDVYKGKHTKDAPDIIFYTKNFEYSTKTYSEFASNKLFSRPDSGFQGDHRLDGMYIIKSNLCTECGEKNAIIYDIAPTVLSILGIHIPKDMDGKSLVKVNKNKSREESKREEEKRIKNIIRDLF